MLDHSEFISDPNEQVASLRAVDRDLANQLVEALGIKFFSHGADARLPGLPFLKLLLQFVLKMHHVELCGGRLPAVTEPKAARYARRCVLFRRAAVASYSAPSAP